MWEGTGRYYKEVVGVENLPSYENTTKQKDRLQYVDQPICSARGMPSFHVFKSNMEAINFNENSLQEDVDWSGDLVDSYVFYLNIAYQADLIWRIVHGSDRQYRQMEDKADVPTPAIVSKCRTFQTRVVSTWSVPDEPSKLLVMPVNNEKSMTVAGSSNNCIESLYTAGMLVESTDKSDLTLEPVSDIAERWQLICGDGLTLMRMMSMRE